MKMKFLSILGAMAVIAVPATARAQHQLVLQKLRMWDSAAPVPPKALLVAEVMKTAEAIQKATGGCKPSSVLIESVSAATGVRFVFEGILGGRLKNGWTIVANSPNCGSDVARYTIVQNQDGTYDTIRTNQGRSHANESLIGDTFPAAILAAEIALKRAGVSCGNSNPTLGILRISQEEADLGPEVFGIRYAGSWSEVWPINLCGRTAEVLVRFTADGDGGAYHSLKGDKVKVLSVAT